MAFFRGQTGYCALGGQLQGSPLVNGALLAGATTLNLDGSSLLGSVAVGDTFTIAGESGTPTHTVTGGPFYLATTNAITGLTFSGAIAVGGAADNAAITFTSNAVAQITQWALSIQLEELETTVMGDSWKSVVGGIASWSGNLTMRIDLTDVRQAALVAKIVAGSPTGTVAALTLGIVKDTTPQIKQFYGAAILKDLQIQDQLGQIVSLTAGFTGSGSALSQWV